MMAATPALAMSHCRALTSAILWQRSCWCWCRAFVRVEPAHEGQHDSERIVCAAVHIMAPKLASIGLFAARLFPMKPIFPGDWDRCRPT